MAFDKFFDKAKETAKKAKETAAEMLDAGAESAIKTKDAAVDMIDVGKDKLHEGMVMVIEETNKMMTILQNSGFRIMDISMSISLPPKAKLVIEDMGDGEEKLSKLMESEEQTLSKVQTGMIKALLRTYDLTGITEEYGYKFGKFQLTVSIPPQVTIHLVADK